MPLDVKLEDIMSEGLIRVKESIVVGDVAHLLMRYQINGVLIVDDNNQDELIGVLTTTDLLKFIDKALSGGGQKKKALERTAHIPVGKVASKNIISLQKDDSVTKAIALMHKKHIHTLPVFDKGKLVGVIGRHDILNVALAKGPNTPNQKIPFKNKRTILSIEDNLNEQKFIQTTLKKQGYHVVTANTGKMGLEMIAEHEIDLVILDVNLPDCTGNDVFKKLKSTKKYKDIPILVLTVVDDPLNIVDFFQLGAMNYLIKPIDAKQLLMHVGYLFEWSDSK